MTFDQIETLIAIAQEGGLRAAANKINKTQPSLSVSIKNLEEEIGLELFDRDTYRMTLTEQGNTLYQKALSIQEEINQFQKIAKEFAMGKEAKINLAIDYLCPVEFLFSILNKFKSSCLETQLQMHFEVLGGSEERLLTNEAQLALTPFLTHKDIEYTKIGNIQLLPVISKKLTGGDKITKKLLEKTPQIIVKATSQKESKIQFEQNINSPQWIVSDHLIKKELILNGHGWGHLEKTSITKELKSKSLNEIKLSSLKKTILPLYLAKYHNHAFGPVSKDLWKFIKTQFKKDFS